MVNTDFSTVRFHGDSVKAQKVYEGIKPLSADDVASAIEFIVTRPEHVCVNDMLLMPTQQADPYHIDKKDC